MNFVNNQLAEFINSELLPDFRPNMIYHYTTIDVLSEFFKDDGDLYCTHCQALNDDEEFLLGLQYVRRYIEREYRVDRRSMIDFVERYYESYRNKWRHPWILSFTTEGDSLFQWVTYTDRQKGGYAVGFDYNELRSRVIQQMAREGDQKYYMYLLPCLYLDHKRGSRRVEHDDLADRLLDFLFASYHDRMAEFFKKSSAEENGFFESLILLFAAMVKNASFKHERECRLVIQPRDELGALSNYKIVGQKPRLPTLMFGKRNPLGGLIRSLKISPHGNRRLLKVSAELYAHKFCEPIAVSDSRSSYNGT